ncbi:hypothetical protein BC2926_31260 [Bacillus cereus]|nr:hypothetical protein bcere0030_19480 [Bacillus cereus AH1273]EOP56331.1 hypothetical protein IKQ_01548 [Bacillus cereus VDM053]GCF75585.1 hypothetical protein BC2926_31260 [Bacillus cereus]SEA06773.1 hypothetical protein SAMN04488146_1011100 [Bacillus nitratireducens]
MCSFQTLFISLEIKGFLTGKLKSLKGIVVIYARSGENEKNNIYTSSIKGLIKGE